MQDEASARLYYGKVLVLKACLEEGSSAKCVTLKLGSENEIKVSAQCCTQHNIKETDYVVSGQTQFNHLTKGYSTKGTTANKKRRGFMIYITPGMWLAGYPRFIDLDD